MTTRNPNPTDKGNATRTTRRGFLAALGAAAPLALAGAAKVEVPVAAAPAPAADDGCINCGAEVRRDDVRCAACGEECDALWSHPTVLAAMVASQAAIAALDRMGRDCDCEDDAGGWCDVCCDVDAFSHVYEVFIGRCEAQIADDEHDARMKRAEVPNTGLPARPAAVLALYDLIDALLDLTARHCEGREGGDCSVCDLADRSAYFANLNIDLLRNGGSGGKGEGLGTFLAMERREVQSLERRVARDRGREEQGVVFLPHTAVLHAGAAGRLKSCRERIALLSNVKGRRRKRGRRGEA